jgi:hypothetical protein
MTTGSAGSAPFAAGRAPAAHLCRRYHGHPGGRVDARADRTGARVYAQGGAAGHRLPSDGAWPDSPERYDATRSVPVHDACSGGTIRSSSLLEPADPMRRRAPERADQITCQAQVPSLSSRARAACRSTLCPVHRTSSGCRTEQNSTALLCAVMRIARRFVCLIWSSSGRRSTPDSCAQFPILGAMRGIGRQRFRYVSHRGRRYRQISILPPRPPAKHRRALSSMQMCADATPERNRQGVVTMPYLYWKAIA